MKDKVTLTFDLHAFGCLPGVLRLRLEETERHKRICGSNYSAEDAEMIDTFIAQLKACLAVADEARSSLLGRDST